MSRTHISSRRWLLLPIDVKVRELHAKVLLSCVAAERGWGALLGPKSVISGKQELLPRGTFIEKNIHLGKIKFFERAQACGNRASAWCEEGLIYYGKEDYFQRRLELESFDTIDYFFAWGDHQARDICAVLNRPKDKIVLSGNPRFDLLRPELRGIFAKKANELRSEYGNMILVNTKFAFINNIEIQDYCNWLMVRGKTKTVEQELLIKTAIDFQKKMFHNFLHMIPVLSQNFTDHTIIIRPHPAESHTPWLKIAQELPNVKVVFEGNSNDWIMAADAMVHNNCTTGVEAFMLGKPAISYSPHKDDIIDHPLPEKVSYSVSNEEELIKLLNDVIHKKNYLDTKREKQIKFASDYIANIDGKLACDRIMDVLDGLDLPKSEATFPLRSIYVDSIINILKKIKRSVITEKISPQEKQQQQKIVQIFSSLDLYEIKNILEQLQQVTGRFTDITIVPVEKNCYCFFKP